MIALTQAEANHLLMLDKVACDAAPKKYPDVGCKMVVSLKSSDGKEDFLLDVTRGENSDTKVSLQTRAREVIVLARLDIGPPHRNPDRRIVASPHLHLYRKGFAEAWANTISADSIDLSVSAVSVMSAEEKERYAHFLTVTKGFEVPEVGATHEVWFDYFLAICRIKNQSIVEWR